MHFSLKSKFVSLGIALFFLLFSAPVSQAQELISDTLMQSTYSTLTQLAQDVTVFSSRLLKYNESFFSSLISRTTDEILALSDDLYLSHPKVAISQFATSFFATRQARIPAPPPDRYSA